MSRMSTRDRSRAGRVLATVALLALTNGVARPQVASAPAGKTDGGKITGLVLGEGKPLPFVQVSLNQAGGGSQGQTKTSADGRFSVSGLQPGVYLISVYAPAFQSDDLENGRIIARVGDDVTIRLDRGGVITGRVTDEKNRPVVAVAVSADRIRDEEGRSRRNSSSSMDAFTDDQGVYRLFGLPAGTFVVHAGQTRYMFRAGPTRTHRRRRSTIRRPPGPPRVRSKSDSARRCLASTSSSVARRAFTCPEGCWELLRTADSSERWC